MSILDGISIIAVIVCCILQARKMATYRATIKKRTNLEDEPLKEQLKAIAFYKQVRDIDGGLTADAYELLLAEVNELLVYEGYRPNQHTRIKKVLDDMESTVGGKNDFVYVYNLREDFKDEVLLESNNSRLAKIVVDKISEFMGDLTPQMVLGSLKESTDEIVRIFKESRETISRRDKAPNFNAMQKANDDLRDRLIASQVEHQELENSYWQTSGVLIGIATYLYWHVWYVSIIIGLLIIFVGIKFFSFRPFDTSMPD